jgi:hypothetical protein
MPLQDYETATNVDDWDALKLCCDDAKQQNIIDADCNSLPPRPTGPAPQPPNGDDNNTPGANDE